MINELERLSALLAPGYSLQRELGRGGMAVVYAGTDLKHRRPVAIKLLDDDASASMSVERFLRETTVIAQLQHPHIVPLLDSGRLEGRPYFVMPLIEGESLRARLAREGQLPMEDVLAIGRDVASALDHAHDKGIVHRDVKPENILLTGDGALVADFGIALGGADGSRLTGTGLVVGTPAYMSPEQASGQREIDGRSDVYSFACVLYEALAGHAPFSGTTPRELIARHLSDAVPPLQSARPDLPPQVSAALIRAMAKVPADRPRSARAFVHQLAGTERSGPTVSGRARGRRAVTAAGLVAAAIVAVTLIARRGEAFEARGWLLLADLDNRTGEALFDDALTSALSVSLEQSKYANVLPRQVVTRTLRAMGRADTTRLTATVAPEVAQRANGAAIVFPTIERGAAGYTLTLRVQATGSQRELAIAQSVVRTAPEVLPALGGLASRIRKELGERLRAETPQVPLESATTSSLDALRSWNEGQRHFRAARYDAAITAYLEAVALDSNFALAHKGLGVSYYWQNNRERGNSHFDRALSLTSRLTERERLAVLADAATWRGRDSEAITTYRRMLELYPDDRRARSALAYALLRADRNEEAVTEYQTLLASDSGDFSVHINMATVLSRVKGAAAALPHYAHAFALQPGQLKTGSGLVHEYSSTYADAGFPDSARRVLEGLAGGAVIQRAQYFRSLGLLDVRQGRGDTALRRFRDAVGLSREMSNPTTEVRNRLYLVRTLVWLGRAQDARRELALAVSLLQPKRIEPGWIAIAAEVAAEAGERSLTSQLSGMVAARADTANSDDRTEMARARTAAALSADDIATAVAAGEVAVARQNNARSLVLLGRAYERAGRLHESRDRFAECAQQREGGYEGTFAVIECRAGVARTSLALGDTTRARAVTRAFLGRWPDTTGTFVLRSQVAALFEKAGG